MKTSWMTFTQAEVDRWRGMGFVTNNGVVFHEEYVPDGCVFTLINEGQSKRTLALARAELRRKRDVVGRINLAEIEDE